jgi:hypothetical protein
MGLLDNAIREHLEFKRLHGADPEEVAREEHEALGPVHRGGESVAAGREDVSGSADRQSGESLPSDADFHSTSSQPPPRDLIHGGQETAELDMRTVLKTGEPAGAESLIEDARPAPSSASTPPSTDAPAPGVDSAAREISAEDSLEWEVPGGSPPGDTKQNDGTLGDVATDTAGESVEDVLEETPDFLRETPDQERLWFEQQPPRDFDFDK